MTLTSTTRRAHPISTASPNPTFRRSLRPCRASPRSYLGSAQQYAVRVGGRPRPAHRAWADPRPMSRRPFAAANSNHAGRLDDQRQPHRHPRRHRPDPLCRGLHAGGGVRRRTAPACASADVANAIDSVQNNKTASLAATDTRGIVIAIQRQPDANTGRGGRRRQGRPCPKITASMPLGVSRQRLMDRSVADPRGDRGRGVHPGPVDRRWSSWSSTSSCAAPGRR